MHNRIQTMGITTIAFALFLAGIWPQPVFANMGPATSGGQIVAEPNGLETVEIIHETLTIDLRPLMTNDFVHVEAIYEIENHAAARQIDLVFPTAAATVTEFQVWLNETELPSQRVEEHIIPKNWLPPDKTPSLHGEATGEYYAASQYQYSVATIGFSAPLTVGRQKIRVRYQADVTTNFTVNQFPGHPRYYPTRFYQFAYVLAPARSWGGFGGLDVTIELPTGWLAASDPLIERTADRLTGHFTELPADAIMLTVQPPAGLLYWFLRYLSWALFGLALFGSGILCWRAGRARSKANHETWIVALGLALLWSLSVMISGLFVLFGPDRVITTAQMPNSGYGIIMIALFLVVGCVILLPIGCLITIMAANSMRSSKPRVY